jgi:hypothetical protein
MPPFRAARSLLAERLRSAPCPALNTGRDAHRRLSSGLAIPDPLPTSELDSQLAAARIGVRASDFRTILRAVNLWCSLHQSVVVRRASSGRFITPAGPKYGASGELRTGDMRRSLGSARPSGQARRTSRPRRHGGQPPQSPAPAIGLAWTIPRPAHFLALMAHPMRTPSQGTALGDLAPAYRPRLLSQAIITKQKSNPWRRFASKATRARNV